eukprot:CAMPEP_0194492480 /NCGR_PEP_ID=MMETSP0253-20130528/11021_1 /TAXON_ID=2966 /ORGANISM="Noctiluca scintillans" /LENGTH=262 /DNA_ID=CAMNT_0039333349 /DNA_START=77 /DNA_END=863 /DNA_ORIENTATION=+
MAFRGLLRASKCGFRPSPAIRSIGNLPLRNIKFPTIEEAKQLPMHPCVLSHETLIVMAEQGCNEACFERLVRNVMAVDNLEWTEAKKVASEIRAASLQGMSIATLPAKVGIFTGVVSGIASIPLVFNQKLATWFNQNFVTTDVPEPADLETVWEIGAWTWNWMEPALGTASFALLAAQFTRSQMLNCDIRPYSDWVQQRRAGDWLRYIPSIKRTSLRTLQELLQCAHPPSGHTRRRTTEALLRQVTVMHDSTAPAVYVQHPL